MQEFQKQPANMALGSALWDLSRPEQADTLLQPGSQLTCVNYNLKDANMLGGGMYNGQFGVFDPRKGSGTVDVTPLEHSHRCPPRLSSPPPTRLSSPPARLSSPPARLLHGMRTACRRLRCPSNTRCQHHPRQGNVDACARLPLRMCARHQTTAVGSVQNRGGWWGGGGGGRAAQHPTKRSHSTAAGDPARLLQPHRWYACSSHQQLS